MRAPGPKGVPWWGAAHRVAEDSCAYLVELHAQYGDVVEFTAAGTRVMAVFDPDHIEHILVKNQKNYMKDAYLRRAHDLFGQGLLTNEGDDWLQQRRKLQPAFHKQRIDGYGESMRAAVRDRIAAQTRGASVDFQAEMSVLTLDILNRCLFGREGTKEAAAIARPVEMLTTRFAEAGFILEPKWWPSAGRRRWRQAIAQLEETLAGIVKERRGSPGDDLLTFMLDAFPEERVRDEALTLLLAGHETTALSLSYAWYLLAKHPAQAAALKDACMQAYAGEVPGVADLGKVPLLDQVMKETLRLYPPVYMVAREAIGPDKIAGYDVKPGTQVVGPQWVMHRDPRWFSQPESFQPQRWIEPFEKGLPKYAYFPFGGGPRLCIGLAFAQLEAKIALAGFIQHFTPALAFDGPLEILQSITLRPKHGLQVTM